MMNPIQALLQVVSNVFPAAKCALDAPSDSNGPSYLDIDLDGYGVVVAWRDGHGFGITAGRVGAPEEESATKKHLGWVRPEVLPGGGCWLASATAWWSLAPKAR